MRIGTDLNAASGRKLLTADTATLLAFVGYAGEAITPAGLEISFAGAPSAPLLAQIRKSAAPTTVSIRRVRHSQAELEATIWQIAQDQPLLSAAAAAPSRWGIDYASNKVEVWLQHYSAAAAARMQQRYGGDLVEVAAEAAPLATRYTNRTADAAPWWGGDRVYDTTQKRSCTGGSRRPTASSGTSSRPATAREAPARDPSATCSRTPASPWARSPSAAS